MTFGISRFLPTDYTGPQQNIAPLRCFPREPTTTDKKFPIGQLIIIGKNPSSGTQGDIWYLSKFDSSGDAIWLQLLSGAGSPGVDSLTTDDGAPVVDPDGNGNINVLGGTSITTAGQGPSTVTINLDADVANSYLTDSGSATPAANVISIVGGTGVDTAGSGSTVTINASASVPTTFTSDLGVATPVANNLNVIGSGGISTSGAADTLTISGTGMGISWSVITAATKTVVVQEGYFANRVGGVAFTLPATAAVGDAFAISAIHAGGWSLAQNASQYVRIGNQVTNTGVAGSLASTAIGDTISVICSVANTGFQVISSMGNITVI